MEQYIPKSALVAEIERRINEINLDSIEDWRYRLQREHDIEVMKKILSLIDTLEVKEVQEEPVSEELFEASAEYAATGEIFANGKEMIDFQKQKDFIAGAEWKKAKLPKWKNKPLGGGCWSGEISVDPIRRSYRYEHYIINADKLFKLLDKEE